MKYLFYYTLFFSLNFAEFDWLDDGAPVRQGLHIEWQRTADANSDGSIIYAWSDCRNGVRDVIAQKVDANGNNLWGEYGVVVVNAEGRQEDPRLVTDGNGGSYIVWMDYRDETDVDGDIYAQHVLSDGSLAWGPQGLALTNQPGKQEIPNICSDGQGGAYVIWKDSSTLWGDIYATHLSGVIIAEEEGVPIITYSSTRSNPSLETGGSGDAVLVWHDDRNIDLDLYAQRISVGSNTINTEWGSVGNGGKLVCDAPEEQTSPKVVQYNGDETIIAWSDDRNSSTDVYYQILDGNGYGILTDDGESACTGNGDIINPRVKAENSVAYIVWEDQRNDVSGNDIYAQKINASGNTEWGNGLAISISEDKQFQPRLYTDGNGGVYFVWEDKRNYDVSGIDIYAQHVNSNGSITYDTNGELICNAADKQFNPLVRDDGSGGALIVWADQRTGGSYGIYLQHLTSSGINLAGNGKESFFGISTEAANEPYYHNVVYLGDDNDEALVYWQDNRWGESKIYGMTLNSSFLGLSEDYFSNLDINGQQLSSLDLAQEKPKAIFILTELMEKKIFLSFKVQESPNENLYFQLLDMDLEPLGNATALSDPETSIQGFDMAYGDDGIYYAYSENYDISLKKLDTDGNIIWTHTVVETGADDIIIKTYPLSGTGCIIIYETEAFLEGTHVHAMAVDGNGQVQNGWPVTLSNLSENQYYESSSITEEGIFISFKDNTSGNYDVYGQHVLFNGSLDLGPSGKTIANGTGDQQSSSLAYDPGRNEVFVCYDKNTDLYCNEISLGSNVVHQSFPMAAYNGNQGNPFVYWSGHSFMIAWTDGRNVIDGMGNDIYFQEYNSGQQILQAGGDPVSSFIKNQEEPIISQYSDSLYVILWEDSRSTGKDLCTNLYGQSYFSKPCCALGNLDCDGGDTDTFNVLDVVLLANCVLNDNCADDCGGNVDCFGCAADVNGDGGYNVLDIVTLANCVLGQNCGGRIDDATASRLIMINNMVSIEGDGFIGGVQMTLQHEDDFSIKMTNNALFSDYLTSGNETRLLVITPETDELFSYSGDFDITEVIVANSHNEVSVDLPTAFRLTAAYPNPFNPTTTMKLFMPVAGEMQIEIYNLLGQSVAILANGYMEKGDYDLTWDAFNFSSGMYFVKAQAEGFTTTQKLMLIK